MNDAHHLKVSQAGHGRANEGRAPVMTPALVAKLPDGAVDGRGCRALEYLFGRAAQIFERLLKLATVWTRTRFVE
jgi:hypothetical protein